MKEIVYDFVHLDSDETFLRLGTAFGGEIKNNTITFDNDVAKGKLTKWEPDQGLWIRKWSLTTFQQIMLRKQADTAATEKKHSLVYLLDPSLFQLAKNSKKVNLNGHHTSLFFSNDVAMDFSVVPKQPFYCLDIAFTTSWLQNQFTDADDKFKKVLREYIDKSYGRIMLEPCCINEYHTLHDLETAAGGATNDPLFVRLNIYGLVVDFFSKIFNHNHPGVIQTVRMQ